MLIVNIKGVDMAYYSVPKPKPFKSVMVPKGGRKK
jgi:hypothetical protein